MRTWRGSIVAWRVQSSQTESVAAHTFFFASDEELAAGQTTDFITAGDVQQSDPLEEALGEFWHTGPSDLGCTCEGSFHRRVARWMEMVFAGGSTDGREPAERLICPGRWQVRKSVQNTTEELYTQQTDHICNACCSLETYLHRTFELLRNCLAGVAMRG